MTEIIAVAAGIVAVIVGTVLGVRKPGKKKGARNPLEFGQKIVITSWAVTVAWITLSYVLAWFDKSSNESLSTVLASGSFADTIGYFAYQGWLKSSRNKYGVDPKGVPFKAKAAADKLVGADNIESEDMRI
jgi:hypothetical protein